MLVEISFVNLLGKFSVHSKSEELMFHSSEKRQWRVAENFSVIIFLFLKNRLKSTNFYQMQASRENKSLVWRQSRHISERLPDFSEDCFCHFCAFLCIFLKNRFQIHFCGLFPSYDEKYLGPLKYPFNACCDFAIWFFKQLHSLWSLFHSTLSQAAYPCEMLCASFTAIPMSPLVYTFANGILVTTLIWDDDDRKQHDTCPLLFLSVLPSAKKRFLNDKPLKRSNLILKRRNQSTNSKLCGARSVRFAPRNSETLIIL